MTNGLLLKGVQGCDAYFMVVCVCVCARARARASASVLYREREDCGECDVCQIVLETVRNVSG